MSSEQVTVWRAWFDPFDGGLLVESVEGRRTSPKAKTIRFSRPTTAVSRYRVTLPSEDAYFSRYDAIVALYTRLRKEIELKEEQLERDRKQLREVERHVLVKKESKSARS